MKPEIWCDVDNWKPPTKKQQEHKTTYLIGNETFCIVNPPVEKQDEYKFYGKLVIYPYLDIPEKLINQRDKIKRMHKDFLAAYEKCGCPAGADGSGKPLVIAGEWHHDRLKDCDNYVPFDSSRPELVALDEKYEALLRVAQPQFRGSSHFLDKSPSRFEHKKKRRGVLFQKILGPEVRVVVH